MRRPLTAALALSLLATLPACGVLGSGGKAKDRAKADLAASRVTTIGVNAYLWRAALDTLSFMPLVQADSNGGVIVTDWYSNCPKAPAGATRFRGRVRAAGNRRKLKNIFAALRA